MLSKLKIFTHSNNLIPSVTSAQIEAGHFRLNHAHPEHSLILSALTGKAPLTKLYTHGKRRRNTITISSSISRPLHIIDKLLTYTLPHIEDVDMVLRKSSSFYSWRVRRYLSTPETDNLISDRILRKEIFMPLFINIHMNHEQHSHNYLRMLRFPISKPVA